MNESGIRSEIHLIRLKTQAAGDILKSLDDLIEIREKEGLSYDDGKDGLANGAEIVLNEAIEDIRKLKNMFNKYNSEDITHERPCVIEDGYDVKRLLKVKGNKGGK